EDGIRVRNVTGVQTCALPICSVLEFKADEHLVVEQHTITQVTWAEYSEEQLTYTGSDLYEALGEAFASAQGVNGDGTLQLGESKIGRASCRERGWIGGGREIL